jgi:CubicO group peptidase (beta-lactamase class C family)
MPATDDYMRKLGALPLMHQPGERWLYHTSYDVLGVLVARASGKTFEAFMRERLFGPLGMKDTAFSVPAEQLDRLPALYQFNHDAKAFDVFDHGGRDSEFSHSPAFQSGAGGLASTVADYHAFCGSAGTAGSAPQRTRIPPTISLASC